MRVDDEYAMLRVSLDPQQYAFSVSFLHSRACAISIIRFGRLCDFHCCIIRFYANDIFNVVYIYSNLVSYASCAILTRLTARDTRRTRISIQIGFPIYSTYALSMQRY